MDGVDGQISVNAREQTVALTLKISRALNNINCIYT